MTCSDSVIACGCMRSLGPMGLSFVSSGVRFQPCLLVQDMSCQFCQLLESNGLDSTSAADSMAIKTGNENSIVIGKDYIIYIYTNFMTFQTLSPDVTWPIHIPQICVSVEAEGFQRFQVSSNVVCQRFCRPWVIRCPNR